MAIGDLDSGARFGLPPIGLPQAHLDTPGSDTERRAMPGLATKSSVFAWSADAPVLIQRTTVTGTFTDTVNLRVNTAPGGSSVDVPTWSAGAVVIVSSTPDVKGTSTVFAWSIKSPLGSSGIVIGGRSIADVATGTLYDQLIVPFYDEPFFIVTFLTDGTGTGSYYIRLLGFVRNV